LTCQSESGMYIHGSPEQFHLRQLPLC